MKEPIKQNTVKEWKRIRSEAGALEEDIEQRITYIIRFWFEAFGSKLDTWYFDEAGEGEVGDLSRHMNDDEIDSIYVEMKSHSNQIGDEYIIDKFGHEYGWESSIPTRWLFENFEQEIIDGKKLYEEKEAARKLKQKEKSAQKKLKDKNLAEVAKSKLSKEELAALRREL